MAKKMTPPTILKLLTEIPKNLNSICPENAKAKIVIKATILAFFAVLLRFSILNDLVIDMKIGIVPNGFINVKKEVKTKIANV